eukprot:930178-Amphidinium_carterae.1
MVPWPAWAEGVHAPISAAWGHLCLSCLHIEFLQSLRARPEIASTALCHAQDHGILVASAASAVSPACLFWHCPPSTWQQSIRWVGASDVT